MEAFAQAPSLTPRTLAMANEFRIWMKVIFISELADISGKSIPWERIANDSEWRAIQQKKA